MAALMLLALFTSAIWAGAQPADSLMLQAKAMLWEGTTDQALLARATFERLTADDDLATLAHYYAALVAHQLVAQLIGTQPDGYKKEVIAHLDYAIDHLQTATKRDPNFAEAWALLASVYGQKISQKPLTAVALGRKSNKAKDRAHELAPDNPRVVLLAAIGDYNTPVIWGGDKERALEGFQRAAALFLEQKVSDPLQPGWGHSRAYAWLGMAYVNRGNLAEARQAYERALEIDPEFVWVKRGLMPALKRQESAVSN